MHHALFISSDSSSMAASMRRQLSGKRPNCLKNVLHSLPSLPVRIKVGDIALNFNYHRSIVYNFQIGSFTVVDMNLEHKHGTVPCTTETPNLPDEQAKCVEPLSNFPINDLDSDDGDTEMPGLLGESREINDGEFIILWLVLLLHYYA